MSELEGTYKLTEQCTVDFSLQVALCEGKPKKLSRREFIVLQVLTDAAIHNRVATFQDFGNALWPETGWDDARRQALKDAIHDLRDIVGNIILARRSVGYQLAVKPVPQGDETMVSASTTGVDPSPYVESLDKVDSNASRTADILKHFENLSNMLHTDPNISQVLQSHQARLKRYQFAPKPAIERSSRDLYDVTTGADISRFEQEVAHLDYMMGEISTALCALQSASYRLKRKIRMLNELGHSHVEAEFLLAQNSMVRFSHESQLLTKPYAQTVASMDSELSSCEHIISNLRHSLSSMQDNLPHTIQLRKEPFYILNNDLESSNHHLEAIHECICYLSSLYEAEDYILETPQVGNTQR